MQGCVIGTPATCLGTSQALLTMKLSLGASCYPSVSSLGWALASMLGFNVTPEPALPERDVGKATLPMCQCL